MNEIPSLSNVKSIVAYVEVCESRILKSKFVSQSNDNSTSSKNWSTQIKVGILYMKPKLLTAAHHDIVSSLGCDLWSVFEHTQS